jgi:hypothetical protein
LLNNLKNPLTGPIRFEPWPQLRKIGPSNLRGHYWKYIMNSRTRPKVLIPSVHTNELDNSVQRLFWSASLLWSSEYMSRSSQYATKNMYMCRHVTNLIFSVSFLTTQLLKSKLWNKILQKYSKNNYIFFKQFYSLF